MSTKYRFSESHLPHFITLTLVEWIDLFSREKYKELIMDSLKFCISNKGLTVHAYVIMTNHIHLIVSAKEGVDLTTVVRDFKRYTAKVIYETLESDQNESRRNWLLWILKCQGKKSSSNQNMKVWQHENHPILLDTNKMIDDRLEYLHQNPVEAGICYTPEDYKYSSAGFYAGEIGLLDIEAID